MRRIIGPAAFLFYSAMPVLANLAIALFGMVPVAPGLAAPAGVYFAGAALGLRDLVQHLLGKRWAIYAILAGAAVSYLFTPEFAIASGAAFLLSEMLDFAVYTPLKARGHVYLAVLASNTVGLAVDSICFLLLAFGSLDYLAGQIVGKAEMTIVALALLWLARQWRITRTGQG